MPISTLRIADFRNLSAVELVPCEGINVIYGDNGSGKTSLLEAIHYLGLGRSFRSSTASRLIKHTSDKFSLFAQLMSASEQQIPVGVERDLQGATKLRVAEKDVSSIAEVAYFLPIRVVNSQSHHLLESGPNFRRKYLDWGLFYESDNFLHCWRQFERILKQRNTVLRNKWPKRELDAWTDELVKQGLALDKLRRDYVSALSPIIEELARDLLSISNIEIVYQPGWDENMDYTSIMLHSSLEEYRAGYTLFGPHRADLDMKIKEVSAKHLLSRGQQKLLICAMILAQGTRLAKYANKGLIYLIDDLPSELDVQSREKLISLLSKQQTQIFITAIERETICDFIREKLDIPMKVFHVEQGNVVNGAH